MRSLAYVVEILDRLQPGEHCTISGHIISNVAREIGCHSPLAAFGELSGMNMNPIERIMEKVVGSAYNLVYDCDPRTQHVTFRHLTAPEKEVLKRNNARTYVYPDRRHLYTQQGDFWVPKP